MQAGGGRRQRIAVVGSGVSGLSAAWLLSQAHDVTLYERDGRLGGHANTVTVPGARGQDVAVDTGFIVFNEATYPNFCALLDHLGVPSLATEMSFAVSLDGGRLEYAGSGLAGLFAQRRNIVSPRFWSMLQDLLRFYRSATRDAAELENDPISLGDYLKAGRYGRAFRDDHLLPMAGAIWSAPCAEILSYPASAFIRFHDNHGLLKLSGRPAWRTVTGGSRAYVSRLLEAFSGEICAGTPVASIRRLSHGVILDGEGGWSRRFDQVVVATHAKEALAMLADPSAEERALLGAFRYSRNVAVLHTDEALMPRRRAAWSSWNHIGDRRVPDEPCAVTYWMNRLQHLPDGQAVLRDAQSAAPAAGGDRAAHRDLRASALRQCRHRRAITPVVPAGPAQHLVLRRPFRRRLPRGRAAGGPRRRRGSRRPQAALVGARRFRSHRKRRPPALPLTEVA
jgi:predicted NAD/FAD-binding protein